MSQRDFDVSVLRNVEYGIEVFYVFAYVEGVGMQQRKFLSEAKADKVAAELERILAKKVGVA